MQKYKEISSSILILQNISEELNCVNCMILIIILSDF